MNKIIPAAFVVSIILGIVYQNRGDYQTSRIYAEAVSEYRSNMAKAREKAHQDYLASLSSWGRFKEEIVRLSKIHHFSPNVPIAQCALESGHGTSYYAVTRNNFCGLGAYDSNPDAAMVFNTPEDTAQYWVLLMQKRYPRAWENRTDPIAMLTEIKRGGYATSPTYITKVAAMPEFNEL